MKSRVSKEVLRTGQVAEHCQVSGVTVWSWIKKGKLKAHSTPGGHKRVLVADFQRFLQEYGMPPFEETGSRPRILIADDEPLALQTMAAYLRKAGEYEVATARDGFEAGLLVGSFKPDLIVLDLFMPQLDGFSVCRRLKSSPETSSILVLVVTGLPTEENLERAREAGADDCMGKVGMTALKERADALLARRSRMSRVG